MKNRIVTMCEFMMPFQANIAGNVHGGEIMKMMDNAAGAVAIKYTRGNCVTARVDELEFHLPIMMGSLVSCTATIDYVGRTSMEVFVEVESEDIHKGTGVQRALSAYFTMVALGENGRPRQIPAFTPQTEEEMARFEAAKARRESRQAAKETS